jgi:hypothetical protein
MATIASTMITQKKKPANKPGFWSAILTAILSGAWFIVFTLQQAVAPFPQWRGAEAYIPAFTPMHLLAYYPSIVLPPVFLVLLACIHVYAGTERKVWSLSALAIGVLYATMASINYNIQLVSVRPSLLSGETEGLAMFLQANPHSIVPALANSYAYMALAMLCAAFVFGEGRLERWIRGLLLMAGFTAPLMFAYTLFDLNITVLVLSVVPWLLGAVGATALLAVLFWCGGQQEV